MILEETPDYINVISDANIYEEDNSTGMRRRRKSRRLPDKEVGAPFEYLSKIDEYGLKSKIYENPKGVSDAMNNSYDTNPEFASAKIIIRGRRESQRKSSMNDSLDMGFNSKPKDMLNGFEVVNADKLGQYSFDKDGNIAA